MRALPGVTHMGILVDESVVMDIVAIATGGRPSYT